MTILPVTPGATDHPTTRDALALLTRLLLEVASRHEPGTLHCLVAQAAAAGVEPEALQALVKGLRVRPVITAHPTEAKRVTVLERLRRIYRLLLDHQTPRWTAREPSGIEDSLRNETEVLLLTGELRLEKPQGRARGVLGSAVVQRDTVRRGAGTARQAGRGGSAADNLVEDLRAMELALEAARADTRPRPGASDQAAGGNVSPRRLDLTIARAERGEAVLVGSGYTARLGLRDNSTRTTEALQGLWRMFGGSRLFRWCSTKPRRHWRW